MAGSHSSVPKPTNTGVAEKPINISLRDESGRVLIDRSDEETGNIQVSVLDERYLDKDFKFVVNTKFRSLQNAASAESYVMTKFNNFMLDNAFGIETQNFGNDPRFEMTPSDAFFSNLANLINVNSDNIVAQKQKIKMLEETINEIKLISKEKENIIYLQENQIAEKQVIISEKDREIELLKETVNSLITKNNNE